MFIKTSKLTGLMKEAYKHGGLRVARNEGFLTLEGRFWALQVEYEKVPKDLMGELVKLTGEIPEDGTQYLSTENGNQEEIMYRRGDYIDVYRNAMDAAAEGRMLEQTQFIVTNQHGTPYRVYQEDDEENTLHLLLEARAGLIDRSLCGKNEELHPAYFGMGGAYTRRSEDMAISISMYVPEELVPAVEFLGGRGQGNDLIGIMESGA